MAKKEYDLFCADPFGEKDEATDICNAKLVPYLANLGIKQKDIKKVVAIVGEIAREAYLSGADNERFNISEGDY